MLAIPLLATSLANDPRVIAALVVTSGVPSLLLALPVGARVDRSHRARLMVGSDLACAVVLGTLVVLLLTGQLALWHLFALSAGLGIAELVFGIASFALLPSIVSKGNLVEANGYLSTSSSLGAGIVGPNLGGLAYAASPALPLLANGMSYLLSSVLIGSLIGSFAWHRPAAPESAQRTKKATRRQRATTYLGEVTAGIALIRKDRSTRTLLILGACSGIFGWMPEATLVLYAKQELHLSAQGFGILLSVTTVGAVLGSAFSDTGSDYDRSERSPAPDSSWYSSWSSGAFGGSATTQTMSRRLRRRKSWAIASPNWLAPFPLWFVACRSSVLCSWKVAPT